MRTSPPGMRRRHRRAPLALLPAVALVVGLAACSDDGDDADTSPTTTSPTTEATDPSAEDDAGDGTTTAPPEEEDATPDGQDGTDGGGEGTEAEGDVLDQAQVEDELRRLYDAYVAAFVAARERGALDEAFEADLARIFEPELLRNELDGIASVGGLAAVVPRPAPVAISEVSLQQAPPGCASGSAVFDLRPLVGERAPGPLTRFFKLEQSDAQEGWRFSALGSTEAGEAFAGARCEEDAP